MKAAYSTQTPGIGGEIKRRIEDFKVREITPSGELCKIEAFIGDSKIELKKEWPDRPADADHLILTLEKFNYDLNQALKRVARWNGVSVKRIGYAGLKDKRGVTSQRISIWQPNYEQTKKFQSRYIDLRDAQWSKKRVELGDSKGNQFELTIRNIELDKKEVEKRLKACFKEMEEGVANFFGEQRFGGHRQITHVIGKQLLKGNFEDAVMTYLTSISNEDEEDIKTARLNLASSKDFRQAIKEFPYKYKFERTILHHLVGNPNDFVGAFMRFPKNMRFFFTHALQSDMFNKIIQQRMKEKNWRKVEGDIMEDEIATIPLIGFESTFAEGKAGEIEKNVLKDEGLTQKEFYVKALPLLSSKGGRKKLLLFPKDLKVEEVSDDEFYEGKLKARVSFSLDKGSYATTILRELMKTE